MKKQNFTGTNKNNKENECNYKIKPFQKCYNVTIQRDKDKSDGETVGKKKIEQNCKQNIFLNIRCIASLLALMSRLQNIILKI